jgi:hypothetical protein
MKRMSLFVILVTVCFSAFVFADAGNQKPSQQPAVKTEVPVQKTSTEGRKVPGPAITFESIVYDFNNVNPGSNLSCEFKFTNTGDSQLQIKDVQTTCGCTVPKLEKNEYKAGESGTIKVNFAAGSGIGPVTKQLYVLSNDAIEPRLTLTLKANVVKKVAINPETIVLSLKKPNAGCPDITLTSIDGNAFAITGFKSSPDCMKLDFDPNSQAVKFVLSPQVDVQKLKKSLRGTIHITLNHPECKEVTALFDAPSLYKTTPPTLLLFNAEPRKPITRDKVWLLSNYNEDFEVESTSSDNGYIKATTVEKVSPGRYALNLTITPPNLAEPSKATRFFTDNFVIKIKGGERVEISCRGYYAKQKAAAAPATKQ